MGSGPPTSAPVFYGAGRRLSSRRGSAPGRRGLGRPGDRLAHLPGLAEGGGQLRIRLGGHRRTRPGPSSRASRRRSEAVRPRYGEPLRGHSKNTAGSARTDRRAASISAPSGPASNVSASGSHIRVPYSRASGPPAPGQGCIAHRHSFRVDFTRHCPAGCRAWVRKCGRGLQNPYRSATKRSTA